MAIFDDVQVQQMRIGENGYIQVARRRIVENGKETTFLSISRGFFETDGTPRWMKYITLPDDPDVIDWLRANLTLLKGASQPSAMGGSSLGNQNAD